MQRGSRRVSEWVWSRTNKRCCRQRLVVERPTASATSGVRTVRERVLPPRFRGVRAVLVMPSHRYRVSNNWEDSGVPEDSRWTHRHAWVVHTPSRAPHQQDWLSLVVLFRRSPADTSRRASAAAASTRVEQASKTGSSQLVSSLAPQTGYTHFPINATSTDRFPLRGRY